jgi:nucleotide-binding universal stress UspA family protein
MGSYSDKRILVAVDGSEASRAALQLALDLGQSLSCAVTALAVVQTRMPGYRAGYFSFVDRHIIDELRQFSTAVLDEAKEVATHYAGVAFTPMALEGEEDVYEQLSDYLAKSDNVAFLVMGSYGHGVRGRHILGSTTERLILEIARRGMKTPVLVVP